MDSPIACTLTEAQMRERRAEILEPFRAKHYQTEVLANGYAYTLEAAPAALVEIARLVDLERQCCPFLSFTISIAAGDAAIRLAVTGPPEAMAMISEFFGS